MNRNDKSISDYFILTDTDFNKDTLLFTIINKGGTFEPLYSTPDFFYWAISKFWAKWKNNFENWFEILKTEYNPLDTYNRSESWHDDITDTGTNDTKFSSSENVQSSGSDNTTTSDTTTNTVSAYDSSTYQPHDKSENSGSNNTTTSDTKNTLFNSNNDNDTTNDRDVDHSGTITGNISGKSYQELLKQEMEIKTINLYDKMADIFLNELSLKVY